MDINIKEKYYKLSKDEFNDYYQSLVNDSSTFSFFTNTDKPLYYFQDKEINKLLSVVHLKEEEFNSLICSFSSFGINQIIQSFMISEIQSTNLVENLYSTRHEIFYIANKISKKGNKKIASIINSYLSLLDINVSDISSTEDIRTIYDTIFEGAIEKDDLPDGKLFRKDPVVISNGMKSIHSGFYPEEKIIAGLDEFISFYNNTSIDVYLRMIICHFLIEYIHPFYDGNGRLGRYLFSKQLYKETKSYISFIISTAIINNKNAYYKALNSCEDNKQYGNMNVMVNDLLAILLSQFEANCEQLNDQLKKINNIPFNITDFTNSEIQIIKLLNEATLLSDFGICNNEIIDNLDVSKRTVITTMNKLKSMNLIEDTPFGKTMYHKLKISHLL